MFKKAVKQQKKLRMAITGTAGSGKTFTALSIADGLGGPVALIDTEHGSASLYSDLFDFDTVELTNFHPKHYAEAITAAVAAGYKVLIIDSISHAWKGVGGVLEIKDNMSDQNRFTAWKEPDKIQNQFIEAILSADIHIIATMRSKMAYAEQMEGTKKVIKKLGLAPIQRDGVEYEFDVVMDMNEATGTISKTRCLELKNDVIEHPGKEFGERVLRWLDSGIKMMTLKDAEAFMDTAATEEDLKVIGESFKAQLAEKDIHPAKVYYAKKMNAMRAALKAEAEAEAEAEK